MSDFHTVRCLLKPLESDDRDDVGQLYLSQEVRCFLGGPVAPEQFKRHFQNLLADYKAKTWTVRLKSTCSFIGMVGISKHHDGQDQEVSYQLLPAFWNQGFACEVLGAVIEYAANVMRLGSLIAETQCANHASRRLLEKVGMQPVKTLSRFGEDQMIYQRNLNSR